MSVFQTLHQKALHQRALHQSLRVKKESSDLCRMFHQCLKRYFPSNQDVVKAFRDGSMLKMDHNGPPILQYVPIQVRGRSLASFMRHAEPQESLLRIS